MGKIVFFLALAGARAGWFYFEVSREDAKAQKGFWEGEVMGKIVFFLALAGARLGWF
jgi:hypothetical protein